MQERAFRGNGSPHESHTGGVICRTDPQQILHTQPSRGISKSALHAAHVGASSVAIMAFAAAVIAPKHFSYLKRPLEAVKHLSDTLTQRLAVFNERSGRQLSTLDYLEQR